MEDTEHKSGFVGILGAPNVGKSTLLNRLLGEKVAITSDKPQTTRHRILGVLTRPEAQIIFMDTPGVHRARDLLNKELVAAALGVLPDVDLILFLVEPGGREEDENLLIAELHGLKKPVILAINKIDRMNKPELLPLLEAYRQKLPLAALVPISALKGDNLSELVGEIIAHLPPGPQYYPPETLTDQPERFIAAEMIREQVFRRTGQEIPYSTAVTVEAYKYDPQKDLTRISAEIHVERDSQKKIVIGRKGAKLKEIGTAARLDLERLTGGRVFLELFVRVQKKWTQDPEALRRFGYKR
ncbi:MAG: GTPase Era [Thermodesulfobacteriota bacterium]